MFDFQNQPYTYVLSPHMHQSSQLLHVSLCADP